MDYNAPTGATDPNAGYVGKNVSIGQQGSKVPPKAAEYPQREIVAAIRLAGLVSSNSDLTQLMQAISRGLFLGTVGGNVNALTATLPGAGAAVIPLLLPYMRFRALVANTNTSGVTVTIAGFGTNPGALNLLRRDGAALQAGDLVGYQLIDFYYDGAAFRMVGSVASDINALIAAAAVGFGNWSRSVAGTYTWVCPANVLAVQATVIGGGGGGAGSVAAPASNAYTYAGEGGGGGGTAVDTVATVPGQTYAVIVGAAGAAGGAGTGVGGNGGLSAFGVVLSATGGIGGRIASCTTGTPVTFARNGGAGSGARVQNFQGSYGGVVVYTGGSSNALSGAGGSAVLGGQGGVTSNSTGSAGASPGGGGAGSAGTGVNAGQPGADGAVMLVYL